MNDDSAKIETDTQLLCIREGSTIEIEFGRCIDSINLGLGMRVTANRFRIHL